MNLIPTLFDLLDIIVNTLPEKQVFLHLAIQSKLQCYYHEHQGTVS